MAIITIFIGKNRCITIVLLSVTYTYTVCLKKVKNEATSTQHFFSIVAWGQLYISDISSELPSHCSSLMIEVVAYRCNLSFFFLSVIIFLPLALEINWLHLCRYNYENLQDIWSNRHSFVLVSIAFLLHHSSDAYRPTCFC